MKTLSLPLLLATISLFSACGENSHTPVLSDVKAISIDNKNISMYATQTLDMNATATYKDSTTADVSNNLSWESSDSTIALAYGNTLYAKQNGGDVNITASFSQFSDTTAIEIIALKSINFSDINTSDFSNEQTITISGNFENNESNVTLSKNITWVTDANMTLSNSNTSEANITLTSVPSTLHAILFYGTDYAVDFNRTYE